MRTNEDERDNEGRKERDEGRCAASLRPHLFGVFVTYLARDRKEGRKTHQLAHLVIGDLLAPVIHL